MYAVNLVKMVEKNEDLLECERCKNFRNVRKREEKMKDESGGGGRSGSYGGTL